MSDRSVKNNEMPAEIDFSGGIRGLHHIPLTARVFMPALIERSVWEYFSQKAQQEGVDLSELLTDVLRRYIAVTGDAPK